MKLLQVGLLLYAYFAIIRPGGFVKMLKSKYLLLMAILLIATFIYAEEPKSERHLYISIYSGATFFQVPEQDQYQIFRFPWSDENFADWTDLIKFDIAFSVGFRVGYNLTSELDLEGIFQYSRTNEHQRIYEARPCSLIPLAALSESLPTKKERVAVFNYSNNIVYYFFKKKVSPFITCGIGGTTFRRTEGTITNFSINVGGGLKFNLKKRMRIRLDLRDIIIFDQYIFDKTMNNFDASVGIEFNL